VGAIGATGTTAANALAGEADVVLGVGTRWSDFTTASRSVFAAPDVHFVNLNVAPADAVKQAGVPLVGDALRGLEALAHALEGARAGAGHSDRARALAREWDATVEAAYRLGHEPRPAQSEVLGVVNRVSGPRDVVVCAAGSMPGDLHKLWRTRDPKGYHVEYGYSCMGYEIAGGLGVKLAAPDREVFVLVGDGSYLMMAQELVTAVAERIKLTVVLVQNHGYASIGALSESVGSQRFGTRYHYRDPATGALDGDLLPVDLAANAASLGARVLTATTIAGFEDALRTAAAADTVTVVQVETDPLVPAPGSDAWWDVPVAEVSELETTRTARAGYERDKRRQRLFLSTRDRVETS
jgi:3D-(3,5/4)-trihydroxycyclohexane-1,2-dione acylhydrolase (decyclizing)